MIRGDQGGHERLGHSVEKVFLADRLRQLTKEGGGVACCLV
jgi:hypothetical protein